MDAWQETQIQALLSAQTESDFFVALSCAAANLGFDYCAYGMRMPLPLTKPRVFLLNNYPAAWQQRYVRENYLAIDPTVTHGMRSVMPLVWSDEIFRSCRGFWEEAQAHGLRVGWAQSCYNGKGVGGLLTLARSHDDLSAAELRDRAPKMTWLAHAAHEGLYRRLAPKLAPEAATNLSAKETEVLRWTADGKTSGQVSEIMNIAERTVNFHVNNATAKLMAGNKTAAAIKAAMLGLL